MVVFAETWAVRGLMLTVVCVLSGCGKPSRIDTPPIDPQQSAAAAIEACDLNGDALISRDECVECPGLADEVFQRYDLDGDEQISSAEITRRLDVLIGHNIGLVPAWCKVSINDRPVKGAVVVLTPEVFLRDSLGDARGITNGRGVAHLDLAIQAADDPLPGVPPGVYRVSITHPEVDLPARYNKESTLGMEVAPLEQGADNKTFRLELK